MGVRDIGRNGRHGPEHAAFRSDIRKALVLGRKHVEATADRDEPGGDGVRADREIVELGQDHGLVLRRVVAMQVQDEMVLDAQKQLIDAPRLNLIGRMHGRGWYARMRDLFAAPRIARERWMLREENP